MAIPRFTGPLGRSPCAILWPRHGLDSERVETGQTPGSYSPTHAPAMALGEHARVTRCKQREWHQRQERPALVLLTAPTRVIAIYAAASACGIVALLRRARPTQVHQHISRASNASAHCAYAAGRWQSTAAHQLWRLVCPWPVLLVSNLRIGTAAGC